MRRLRSKAACLGLLLLALLPAGCNSVVSFSGTFGDASITGQVSQIRITVVSNGSTSVNVTIVTFLNATTTGSLAPTPATAQDVTFCGHIADRFAMNAVQTVNYNQGDVCGTVVKITFR